MPTTAELTDRKRDELERTVAQIGADLKHRELAKVLWTLLDEARLAAEYRRENADLRGRLEVAEREVESLHETLRAESGRLDQMGQDVRAINRRVDHALEGSTEEGDPFLSEEDAEQWGDEFWAQVDAKERGATDEDALDPEYTARVDRVENETWAA